MSATKHTPGPWRLVDHGKMVVIAAGDSNDFRTIGSLKTSFNEEGNAEQRANARLIAAAPELLALAHEFAGSCAECNGTGLRTIYNYDGHGSDADDQPCHECADIRAVIAKAVTP